MYNSSLLANSEAVYEFMKAEHQEFKKVKKTHVMLLRSNCCDKNSCWDKITQHFAKTWNV